MTKRCPITQKLRSRKRVAERGFSIVESVVAGVLLASVMGGVSRLSVSALASSSNQSERVRIEAAINDNIQLLQMEDSYLRLEEIGSQSQQDIACSNPTSHLKAHLEAAVPPPEANRTSQPIERSFEVLDEAGMDILVARYKFFSPEHRGKNDAMDRWEYRTVELNPNFSAKCYTTVG
jgi:type II secretory pathway pseudopilin PulG